MIYSYGTISQKLHARFEGLNNVYIMFDAIQTSNFLHVVEDVVGQLVRKLCYFIFIYSLFSYYILFATYIFVFFNLRLLHFSSFTIS